MAKVITGPLVSRVSGSIGDITFENTRFGQVIQKKPIPPYPGSAAQQLSIDRFRKAMRSWLYLRWPTKNALALLAHQAQLTPHQQWLAAFYRLLKTDEWLYTQAKTPTTVLHVLSINWAPPKISISTNLDKNPWTHFATHLYIKDGAFWPGWSGGHVIHCPDPPYQYTIPAGLTPPFRVILFPFPIDWWNIAVGISGSKIYP